MRCCFKAYSPAALCPLVQLAYVLESCIGIDPCTHEPLIMSAIVQSSFSAALARGKRAIYNSLYCQQCAAGFPTRAHM